MNLDKRITILYIITDLSIGGAEKMLYSLLSKINKERFKPVIISLMSDGKLDNSLKSLDIDVYTLDMKRGIPSLSVAWRLIRLVRILKPDLIQGWMYHGNIAAQFVKLFAVYKTPVLWSIHHSINSLTSEKKMTQYIIKFGVFLSKFTDKIIFVSNKSKLQHDALGYSSKESSVIPNGFDTLLFKPSLEARSVLRREMSVPEDTFLIGSFGRDHPMKDRKNFLHAASQLLKEFPDVHFVLAGTDVNNKNQNIYRLVADLKIGHRVHLLGERSDMPKVTPALDIFTSSSAYGEAFPLVIGEAMSCGVPCVVTDVGDSAWIVADTGAVVSPKDSKALANAWKELVILKIEDRQALGKAARYRVVNYFSLESIVAQYEALYEKLSPAKI
jgi:glycosyltransferase involved in cell wall biosynthesis